MTYPSASPRLSPQQRQRLGHVAVLYQPPSLPVMPLAGDIVRFGLIADPQYADAEPDLTHDLYYRHSLHKLSTAISQLNPLPLDFVVSLGDLVDRHWASYDALLPRYEALRHPHVAILGNHDAAVISDQLAAHQPALGLPKNYYQFHFAGYRFIVIDGNDISLYCNAGNGDDHQQARERLNELIARQQPQAQNWNGSVGQAQFAWLEHQLQQARAQRETVIVFGHYPLAPLQQHMLWNGEALTGLLCRYQVRAYFAGHDHRGGYIRIDNTDFITLKGMLDSADRTPFAVAELVDGLLTISGYGGEISRVLRPGASEAPERL